MRPRFIVIGLAAIVIVALVVLGLADQLLVDLLHTTEAVGKQGHILSITDRERLPWRSVGADRKRDLFDQRVRSHSVQQLMIARSQRHRCETAAGLTLLTT